MSDIFDKFGDQLAARCTWLLGPTFFWTGGTVAWISKHGWSDAEKRLRALSGDERELLAAAGIVILGLSIVIAQHLSRPLLRVMEGYWHEWAQPIQKWKIERHTRQLVKAEERFQVLAAAQDDRELSAREREEFVRLDARLRSVPLNSSERMPTRLGNTLRAAESRPRSKYGLDATVCWPRIWLMLPESAKKDLTQGRDTLDAGVSASFWTVLFVAWSVWAWWALLVAILGAIAAYRWVLEAAQVYGDLLESVFDIYRGDLYRALGQKMPADDSDEREAGQQLTKLLWRGPEHPASTLIADFRKKVKLG